MGSPVDWEWIEILTVLEENFLHPVESVIMRKILFVEKKIDAKMPFSKEKEQPVNARQSHKIA